MNFKKSRNDFIYNLIPVRKGISESAYSFAKRLVGELVQDKN